MSTPMPAANAKSAVLLLSASAAPRSKVIAAESVAKYAKPTLGEARLAVAPEGAEKPPPPKPVRKPNWPLLAPATAFIGAVAFGFSGAGTAGGGAYGLS